MFTTFICGVIIFIAGMVTGMRVFWFHILDGFTRQGILKRIDDSAKWRKKK